MAAAKADTVPAPALIERFAGIVGPSYAIRDPAAQAGYLKEWREVYVGRTPLVLRPGSVAEVARILALAHETATAIVPQGGNTGLVGAQIPHETGTEVLVSLSRLDKIRTVDPDGNTMIAEAGVTLGRAQDAADAAGRLFPLSLASEGTCQIGGNLSTNAGGVQVLAYGNARDLVLGLEVVLADGQVWNGLRSLRKDNTGYDLKHLFIGGEGTLGIITAAVLKLFPKPSEEVTAIAALPDLAAVRALFERARRVAGPGLTAFELIPRRGIEFVTRHFAKLRDPIAAPHAWYALIDIAGFGRPGEAMATMERLLEGAIADGHVADAAIAQSHQQVRDLWAIRENLPDTQKFEGGSIKHDVSVPIAQLPELIARGDALIEAVCPGARPLPFGHFGDGNLHYNVSQPLGMDRAQFLKEGRRITEAIYGLVLELGGSISAEHGIGRVKRDELVAVKSPVEIAMMRAIKAALDPKGILNPGKML